MLSFVKVQKDCSAQERGQSVCSLSNGRIRAVCMMKFAL